MRGLRTLLAPSRLLAAVCCVGVLCVVPLGAGLAGASPPGWTIGAPDSVGDGECNEVVQTNGSGTNDSGYMVQLACQLIVPVGQTLYAAVPRTETTFFKSNTQVLNWSPGSSGHGEVDPSHSSCGVSTLMFMGVASDQTDDGTQDAVSCESVTGSRFISGGSEPSFPSLISKMQVAIGELDTETVGPSESCSLSGGSCNAVSLRESLVFPSNSGSDACSKDLDADCVGGVDLGSAVTLGSDIHSDGTCAGNSAINADVSGTDQALVFVGSTYEQMTVDNGSCDSIGGDSAVMPADFFTGGSASPPAAPCSLETETGQWQGDSSSSTEKYPYTFTYVGGADEIWVDPVDGASSTLSINGEDYGSDSSVVNDPSSPQTVSVEVVSGHPVAPAFYCSYGGVTYFWGVAGASGARVPVLPTGDGANGGGSFDLGACFATSGMSLTDPVSWVTGAAQDFECVVQWLFIPSPDDVSALTGLFGVSSDSGGSSGAGAWIGALGTFTTDFPTSAVSAIRTAADSGSCPTSGNFTVSGASLNVCNSIAEVGTLSGVSGPWSVIKDILTAVFLVMVVLALFHLLRRVISGNAA